MKKLFDFMTSRAGLALRANWDDASRRRVLTVAQGHQLFGKTASTTSRMRVANEMSLESLAYALGKQSRPRFRGLY